MVLVMKLFFPSSKDSSISWMIESWKIVSSPSFILQWTWKKSSPLISWAFYNKVLVFCMMFKCTLWRMHSYSQSCRHNDPSGIPSSQSIGSLTPVVFLHFNSLGHFIFVSQSVNHKKSGVPCWQGKSRSSSVALFIHQIRWKSSHSLLTKQVVNLWDKKSLPTSRAVCEPPFEQVATWAGLPFIKEGLKRDRDEPNPKLPWCLLWARDTSATNILNWQPPNSFLISTKDLMQILHKVTDFNKCLSEDLWNILTISQLAPQHQFIESVKFMHQEHKI
jgi:hypothetical protein